MSEVADHSVHTGLACKTFFCITKEDQVLNTYYYATCCYGLQQSVKEKKHQYYIQTGKDKKVVRDN